MSGIKSPGRGPHVTSIVPDHRPIASFDPRARLTHSILVAVVVIAFVTILIAGRP